MKISFHGAARTVTGSKHLVTFKNGKKILLDCGMFQGMGKDTDIMNRDFGFYPAEVDVLILSHAHIDHSGLIPKLVKDGFNGKIFCTHATADLCSLLLVDSARIQISDIKYSNKGRIVERKPLLAPLYNVEDAERALVHFQPVDYRKWIDVMDGVKLMFTDAGHIAGSACVHLRISEEGKQQQITFSGDIGRYKDVILKSPEVFPQADFIIMESTYGNSLHDPIQQTVDYLLEWIQKICIRQKGKLIIPAFSLGRTQEILYALNQLELENRLPALDYFLDSPLSISITQIIKNHTEHFNKSFQKILEQDKDPFLFEGLKFIKSVEESKMLNFRSKPCVIISASGMAEAGRVKHHISNNIENSRNGILMTGYCEPRSLGGRLLSGAKEVGIFGIEHEVNAEVGSIRSMSAHGDYEDMRQWLSGQDVQYIKKIFLVHGEYDVQTDFKNWLLKKGFQDIEIPERHQEFGLR